MIGPYTAPMPNTTSSELFVAFRTRLPINVLWQWIPSHQDKLHSFRSLDPLAQDNVLVDNYAKAFLNFQVVTGLDPFPDPTPGRVVVYGRRHQAR
jgi:hypothetical protein